MSTRSVLIAAEGGGIHSMKTKRSAWTPSSFWRIDEAMALLDEMATAADVGFAETHGGQKRRRDKSNPKRCRGGLLTMHG